MPPNAPWPEMARKTKPGRDVPGFVFFGGICGRVYVGTGQNRSASQIAAREPILIAVVNTG
jgi:hypothetical protein